MIVLFTVSFFPTRDLPCNMVFLHFTVAPLIPFQVASVWEEEEEAHPSHKAVWWQEGRDEACSAETEGYSPPGAD